MRILVSGSAGYIGATFCYEALKKGYEVIGFDNYQNSSEHNIKLIKKKFKSHFKFYKKDLLDNNLEEIFSNHANIDCVFHFAALKSVPESEKYPDLYLKNNVEGTKNLLDSMHRYSVKNLVFSSSAAVYGDQEKQPISEQAQLNPKNTYAMTKKLSEDLITEAVKNNGLNAVSLRYFNPIGSHVDKIISDSIDNQSGNVMSVIMRVALGMNSKMNIYGNDYNTADGTGERDYIHIIDLVNGHFKAFKQLNKNAIHEIFNLGTGNGVSVLNLINTFEKVNSIKVNYEFSDRRIGDLAKCFADPSKAKEELNWEAVYNLEDMCKDTWIAINNGSS